MMRYTDASQYRCELEERSQLPEGFRVGTTRFSFTPEEKPVSNPYWMNLALLLLDEPSPSFAGVFTRNQFPGAPVVLARRRLASPRLRGILMNNRIANVCAPGGEAAAERLLGTLAARAGGSPEEYLAASTGIIGFGLPTADMERHLQALVAEADGRSAVPLAEAIMTTDRFPKVRSRRVGAGRIVGVAKGAGMIEPNLATMLVFLLTDVSIPRDEARDVLNRVASATFNRISVDSDQSTSDMVVLASSNCKDSPGADAFSDALRAVCGELAEDIVRNGEGTSHVVRVAVSGAPDTDSAVAVGKAVVNSPLVKTAVCGNDPNVGRILMAVGDHCGNTGLPLDPERVRVSLGDELVFAAGAFELDAGKEERLSAYLQDRGFDPTLRDYPAHDACVEMHIELGLGSGEAAVLGADLSAEYVRENADYRS
jgi:glutamate N-acetyltransferase/amino-acid N-acetyltransferase